MNGRMAKLFSIVLGAILIADVSAVSFINTGNDMNLSSPLGASKTIWVDDDFVDDPPNHKWNTIQEGVDDADPGDTVYVYNGSYLEHVYVKKTIFLEGEDPSGTTVDGSGSGSVLTVAETSSVRVRGFAITNSGEDYAGISISSSKQNTVRDNIISGNYFGIRIGYRGYNVIANNTVSDNFRGIRIAGAGGNNTISGNTISSGSVGIEISSHFNTISNNTISSIKHNGIGLGSDSSHNTISDNIISNSIVGIHFRRDEAHDQGPSGNIISNNTILNNGAAIHLDLSTSNIFDSNVMIDNGIAVWGRSVEYWNTHIINSSNTVNGKPVYYWKNATGGTIPAGAGQVILANCTGVTVENQNVSDGTRGIQLGFSSHSIILNNTVSSNKWQGILLVFSNNSTIADNTVNSNIWGGIALSSSNNNAVFRNNASSSSDPGISLSFSDANSIISNTVTDNWGSGIRLHYSNNSSIAENTAYSNRFVGIGASLSMNNSIAGNNASNNNIGISLYRSWDHTIVNNTISKNSEDGISLVSSDGNRIYHNNLVANSVQAYDSNPADNDWYHPVLLEGNYWSDYAGLDDGSGSGKHAIAGDGIGDTLIPHPETGYDFYPCMVPDCVTGPGNIPPVADAGPDQTVYVGDVVQFDGSGSYDPDAGWRIVTVDSKGRVGYDISLALDSLDNPHIAYAEARLGNFDLKYAKWTGTTWKIEKVDTLAKFGSIALDSYDRPHISYFDNSNGDLKYARWTGSAWSYETVDSIGSVGYTTIALDSNDYPHIGYYDNTNHNLKYARRTVSNWSVETVDSSYMVGYYPSIALDSNDNPHISYYEGASKYDLKYAKLIGGKWIVETVDSSGRVGLWTSLDLNRNDYPHISYYASSPNHRIKYARWSGSSWSFETVGYSYPNTWTSIALDSNDNPHISYYYFDDYDLRYARRTGVGWNIETVDSSGHVGDYASIALDSSDRPHISYKDETKDDLKYATEVDRIVSYVWDFGDGSPHIMGIRPTHTYGNPGIYDVTLTVTDAYGASDADNCKITVLPRNQPPVANANGPYHVDEGTPISLDGSGSHDPDGDALQYRWDLDNDGTWDTVWSSSPYMEHTWGDDYSGNVVLQVSDGEFTDRDTASITVRNVPPTVELRMLPIYVNVSLRIAGEKWHDVSIELYEDDILIAEGSLTRYPGSPNDQMLHLAGFVVNSSREYSAIVRYTPEDDPVNGQPNGANPCWIILTFDDGEEVWLHHNFNVQHPDRYIWKADLSGAILSHGLKFEASAYDPGADDLTFHWNFGDGTNLTSFYPNVNKTFPVEITETVTHIFPGSGTFIVTVTAEDDDAGTRSASVTLVIA